MPRRQLLKVWLSVALVGFVGCNGASGTPTANRDCEQNGPAFRVELYAAGRDALPSNATLTVTYQGTLQESFRLADGARANEDVCCLAADWQTAAFQEIPCGAQDGGTPGRADHILCDIWSNGAASIEANAAGYIPLTEQLDADVDPGCETIRPRNVSLIFERPEGGMVMQR